MEIFSLENTCFHWCREFFLVNVLLFLYPRLLLRAFSFQHLPTYYFLAFLSGSASPLSTAKTAAGCRFSGRRGPRRWISWVGEDASRSLHSRRKGACPSGRGVGGSLRAVVP